MINCVVECSEYKELTYRAVVNNELFYDYYIRTGEPEDGNYEFVYGTTNDAICRKTAVNYTDSYFTNDSRNMNYELAKTSIRLELAAYSSAAYNAAFAQTLSKDNYARATNIMSAYSQMGFFNDKYVGYDVSLTNGSDKAAFSMAMKYIDDGNGGYDTLVTLIVRGGGYGAEWASNFNVGSENNHAGFDGASQKAYNGINDYISSINNGNLIKGDLKLWIVGYSRGAATANLTAHKLNQAGYVGGVKLKPSNMFAYTFATPQGAIDTGTTDFDENIFNFVSGNDLVPKVVMKQWGFGRYGTSYEIGAFKTNESIRSSYAYYCRDEDIDFKISAYQKLTEDAVLDLLSGYFENREYYSKHMQTSIVEGYKQAYTKYTGEDLAKYILTNVVTGNGSFDFTILIKTICFLIIIGVGLKYIIGALVSVFGTDVIIGKVVGFAVKILVKTVLKNYLENKSDATSDCDSAVVASQAEAIVADSLMNVSEDIAADALSGAAKAIAVELIREWDDNNYFPLLENFYSGITDAHHPEYYLACLDNMSVEDFEITGTRLVQINLTDNLNVNVTMGGKSVLSVLKGKIQTQDIQVKSLNGVLVMEIPCNVGTEMLVSISYSDDKEENADEAGSTKRKRSNKAKDTTEPAVLIDEYNADGENVRTVRFESKEIANNNQYTLSLSDDIGNANNKYELVSENGTIQSKYDSLDLGEENEITLYNCTADVNCARENEEITVYSELRENDAFVEWRADRQGVFYDEASPIASVIMPDSPLTVCAVYQSDADGVDINVNGDGGTQTGGGTYQILDTAELTAVADIDHIFIGWYDGDELLSENTTYSFLVTKKMNITAKYSYTPHEHVWNDGEITTQVSCTQDGIITYSCQKCGDTYTETVSAPGHEFTSIVRDNNNGTHSFKCSHCDSYGVGTQKDATAECIYGEWETVSVATCTANGTKHRFCTVCNHEDTVALARNAHTYDKQTVDDAYKATDATCTAKATYYYSCVCGAKCSDTFENGSALGHTPITDKSVAATCTKTGKTAGTHCKVCGTVLTAQKTVKSTGHKPVTVKGTAATLRKGGKTAGIKCSVCNTVITKQTAVAKINTVKLANTSCTYTGKAVKPSVTVKDSKGKTIAAKYYTVTYKNNTSVGKATVTVTFKGNYSGKKTLGFTIVPKGTTITKVTSTKKSIASVTIKKQATQTTGYEIQYSTNKNFSSAKTVKIAKNSTTAAAIGKLARGKTYYFRIRTYKTVSKTNYYSSWSKTVSTKIK